MKEKIYLIGQISVDKKITYKWRQEVKEFFKNENQFEFIDPCDNEWNKSNINFSGKDFKRLKVYKSVSSSLIVPKDYNAVLKSDGCICNMNQYDKNKPIVGTMFELAWYYQNQEKFVIGVFDGDWTNDTYCNHPFVRETVDIWCNNHIEASNLIKDYFKRGC